MPCFRVSGTGGTVHPVKGGTRLIGTGLALALLAAGDGGAWADKLDKDACKALKAEQADLIAGGVRSDMERGPEWAAANLTRDRLDEIKRLIEIGDQLEFRCGSGGVFVARHARKHVVPEGPAKKPPRLNETKRATASPAAALRAPPAHKAPNLGRAETAKPKAKPRARSASAAELPKPAVSATATAAAVSPPKPVAPATVAAKPTLPATVAAKPAATASAPSAVKPAKLAAPAMASAALAEDTAEVLPPPVKPTMATKPTTAKKAARRPSSTTYVSPRDVNPGFLTRYGAGP